MGWITQSAVWLTVVVVICGACELASAQIGYTDFSSVAGLSLNGSASQLGNVLQLNPAAGNQAGTVWADVRQQVVGGFFCQFTFRITRVGAGADGMSFIIHDDPAGTGAIAQPGGSLAYTSQPFTPTNSMMNLLVVELDTYINAWSQIPDSSTNEISVHLYPGFPTSASGADEINSIGRTTPAINFSDGAVHSLLIFYYPGTLEVYLDSAPAPTLSVPFDFATGGVNLNGVPIGGLTLNPNGAYVGFTGTTGGLYEVNEVLSWTFSGSPAAIEYQTNSSNASLTVNGVQGTNQVAATATLGIGVTGALSLSSFNLGAAWDLGYAAVPLLPASAGGLMTGGGQIINLDFADPSFGTWFNFLATSPPFVSLAVPFAIPVSTAISAQFGIADPSLPDGLALSQPTRLLVQ
ncbi:MAG: hypothetical protein HRU14_02360 [Planctomycetes bacterium]|nr:hypothetical protein [Planctomycetota bacterium]